MKVKVEEFKTAMLASLKETFEVTLPNILEDKEFKTICESLENCGEKEYNEEELVKECTTAFTCSVLEGMNINESERLDEIYGAIASWVGKIGLKAIRPFVTKMIKKYGLTFFKSGIAKKICKMLGTKTISSAIGKIFGKKAALKILGKGAKSAAKSGIFKPVERNLAQKAAGFAATTIAGNAIMNKFNKKKNKDILDDYEGYGAYAESINRVFNRHFSE